MRLFTALGMAPGAGPFPGVSLVVLCSGTILAFGLAALVFQWDSRMSQPNRRAALALLAALPYVAGALIG
jgi:hypothetical protein